MTSTLPYAQHGVRFFRQLPAFFLFYFFFAQSFLYTSHFVCATAINVSVTAALLLKEYLSDNVLTVEHFSRYETKLFEL